MCLIIEIKSAQFEETTPADLASAENGGAAIGVEGRKAVALRRWEKLNPDRLQYQILFPRADTVAYNDTDVARRFVARGEER